MLETALFLSKVSQLLHQQSTISPLNSNFVKLDTSTLPTSSSSTVTFASFNCPSGKKASNLDCTIQNDTDKFFEKGKYKNVFSTFFSLRFANDLSNEEAG